MNRGNVPLEVLLCHFAEAVGENPLKMPFSALIVDIDCTLLQRKRPV
jgi:hypothetical protein